MILTVDDALRDEGRRAGGRVEPTSRADDGAGERAAFGSRPAYVTGEHGSGGGLEVVAAVRDR